MAFILPKQTRPFRNYFNQLKVLRPGPRAQERVCVSSVLRVTIYVIEIDLYRVGIVVASHSGASEKRVKVRALLTLPYPLKWRAPALGFGSCRKTAKAVNLIVRYPDERVTNKLAAAVRL